MAEVGERSEDGLSSRGNDFNDSAGLDVAGVADDDRTERGPTAPEISSRPLSVEERRALAGREKERMASPDYRQTLEDPSAVIEAHLRHHGRT